METKSQDSVEERPQSVEEAWEIDRSALVVEKNLEKDLFSGKYKDMEVSIKFLKYSEICKLKKFAETRELSHRNLIQIIGICTKPMNHLVIFEPVSGSLHKAIHIDHISFNPLTQVKMALDVANAMNYVHENGIILGDLKPSNLFLNRHADIKVFGHGLLGGQKLNYACSMHHDVVSYGEALWEILTKEMPLKYVVEEKGRTLLGDTSTTSQSPMEEVFHILKKKIAKEDSKLTQIIGLCFAEETPSFGEIINHLKPSSKRQGTDRKSSQFFHYRDPEDQNYYLNSTMRKWLHFSIVCIQSPRCSLCDWI